MIFMIDILCEMVEEVVDYFIMVDGKEVVGCYLIIDLIDVYELNNDIVICQVMYDCVKECGVMLLYIYMYVFEFNGGIFGVVVLVESYIFVYIWFECNYVVFDVFMCGDVQLCKVVVIFKVVFNVVEVCVIEVLWGEGV